MKTLDSWLGRRRILKSVIVRFIQYIGALASIVNDRLLLGILIGEVIWNGS